MTKILISLFLALTYLANVQAETVVEEQKGQVVEQEIDRSEWSDEDFWREANISFSTFILSRLNNENCSIDVKSLIACMDGLAKGLMLVDSDGAKLVKYDPMDSDENNKFYPFSVETYKDIAERDFVEIKSAYYSELGSQKDLTLAPGVTNIFPLLKYISTKLTKDNSSFVTAEMFNAVIGVIADPHSYIIPSYKLELMSRSEVVRKKKGVGISYEIASSGLYIIEVVEDSPAEKAGLIAGDIITKVNGSDKDLKNALDDADVDFTMEISRRGTPVQKKITKDFFSYKNVTVELQKSQNENFLYIRLRHFLDGTLCETILNKSLEVMKQNEIDGVILDLRNNGGGRVDQAQCLMTLFLEPGSTIWAQEMLLQDPGKLYSVKVAGNKNIFGNYHTTVLVNPYSASASEATSIFLKDYKKAFIVGERSFGKGTMQARRENPRNPYVTHAMTIAKYYGPKGVSPQLAGVEPDFKVYRSVDQKEDSEAKREKDLFMFPIENKIPANYVDQERKKDIEKVQKCLDVLEAEKSEMLTTMNSLDRKFLDNQLFKAKEIISCANKLVEINKSNEVENVSGMEMIVNGIANVSIGPKKVPAPAEVQ